MKAWWIRPAAGTLVLEPRETSTPGPKAGELLVRARAAALNRGEFIAQRGLHTGTDARPAGQECAGEIAKLGEGVTGFAIGDRVMGRARGAYAEYAVMDAREAMPAPSRLSWEEAASVPLVSLVSYDMLYPGGELKPGEWLLITGVSAGVGVASLGLAKALAAKLERLKALGLDVPVQTRGAGFHAAAMAATGGKGVDLVVNNVGGSVFAECVRTLAYQGRLATVGYVDGVMKSEIDIEALHSKRLKLFGVSNKLRTAAQRADTVHGFVRDVLPAIADGRIKPLVDRVFALSDLPAAKAYMESDAHVGKIAVRID